MGITHERVIVAGDRGKSADWNADHIISDDLMPKSTVTKIVAAYDSIDKTRADYVCNGIQDDVEIQAAIDSLPTQGGIVYLKEGTYGINSSIVINKNNVTIQGAGASTIISWNGTFIAITITNYRNFSIYDTSFNGANKSIGGNDAIYFSNSYDNLVNNCWFSHCELALAFVNVSTGSVVTNSTFSDCVYGCYNHLSPSLRYDSNSFTNCDRSITIDFSSDVHILSNSFETSGILDIMMNNSWGGTIIGNHSASSKGYGIILQNGAYWMVISGNYIISSVENGICHWTGHYSTISNNVIIRTGVDTGELRSGIQVRGDYNTITGNYLEDSTNYEIEIESGTGNIISSNSLVGTHIGAIGDSGTNTQFGHNETSATLETHSGFEAIGDINLDTNDKAIIVRDKTPSSATDTGTKGEICWDVDYIYVCVDTNAWKRIGISSW